MTDLTPALQFLVGEPVSEVSFVMDYVELHFNGSYLRILENPTIRLRDQSAITFPAPGSRDGLCTLIDATLEAIAADDDGELRASFSNGASVSAALGHTGRRSSEVLHFRNQATGEIQYW
jgi:hypothetical protein